MGNNDTKRLPRSVLRANPSVIMAVRKVSGSLSNC